MYLTHQIGGACRTTFRIENVVHSLPPSFSLFIRQIQSKRCVQSVTFRRLTYRWAEWPIALSISSSFILWILWLDDWSVVRCTIYFFEIWWSLFAAVLWNWNKIALNLRHDRDSWLWSLLLSDCGNRISSTWNATFMHFIRESLFPRMH